MQGQDIDKSLSNYQTAYSQSNPLTWIYLYCSSPCLPLCQPRAVPIHKDLTGEEKHNDETNYQREKPSAEDYNTQAVNSYSNYHPYGLDTLGRGNIF